MVCVTAVLPGSSAQLPAGCPPGKLRVSAVQLDRSIGAAETLDAAVVRQSVAKVHFNNLDIEGSTLLMTNVQ